MAARSLPSKSMGGSLRGGATIALLVAAACSSTSSSPSDVANGPGGGEAGGAAGSDGVAATGGGSGSGGAGGGGVLVAETTQNVLWMTIDSHSVYCTAFDPHGSATSVWKAPLEGGEVTVLSTALVEPAGIAVDEKYAYVGDLVTGNKDGVVVRIPIDGGAPETLATGQEQPKAPFVHGGNLYWGDGDVLMRLPLDGGSPAQFAQLKGQPIDYAVDDVNLYVAWNEGVSSVRLADGVVTDVSPIGPGVATSVAIDATHLYWVDNQGGKVWGAPIGGGQPATVSTGLFGPWRIASDGATLFVTAVGAGTVVAISPSDGSQRTIHGPDPNILFVAVDATSVYWSTTRGVARAAK